MLGFYILSIMIRVFLIIIFKLPNSMPQSPFPNYDYNLRLTDCVLRFVRKETEQELFMSFISSQLESSRNRLSKKSIDCPPIKENKENFILRIIFSSLLSCLKFW